MKGSDCEIVIPISTCCQHIDIETVENFACYFYTEAGGQAIVKTKSDFEFVGDLGITHFQWQELDQIPDGIIRYTMHYDSASVERNTGYILKTPIAYTPMDFVSKDEVDGIVVSALSSTAATEIIEDVVEENDYRFIIIPGQTPQEYVQDVVGKIKATGDTNWAKIVVYFYCNTKSGSQFVEFHPFYNYRPYDDHEVYLYAMQNDDTIEMSMYLLGLDANRAPQTSNAWRQDFELNGVVHSQDLATVNWQQIDQSGTLSNVDGTETFFVDGSDDVAGAHAAFNRMQWLYDNAHYDDVKKVKILYGNGNRNPDILLMTVEVFNAGSNGSFSAYGMGFSYMDPHNQMKKVLLSYENSTEELNVGETVVVFDDFATTAMTAELEQMINNMPTSSAMTEAINEAVSGLASESYVDSAVSGLASESYVDSAVSGVVKSETVTIIWTGTQEQYDALSGYSNDTLYFIDQD